MCFPFQYIARHLRLPMNRSLYEPLRPTPNCIVFHDELCDLWIDKEGILCSIANNVNRTVEKQKATFALIRKITDDNKVCYLSDSNNTGLWDQETRKHCNKEIPHLFKAIGFIAESPMGQLVTNTFLTFASQSVPMKLFQHQYEARHWIRQYCQC